MRLPWDKSPAPDEPEADDGYEPETDEGGDEPEAADEPQGLDALPAEQRPAAEAYARAQVEAERAKSRNIAENARKRGFVIDESGDLGVADYNTVVGWLAPGDPAPTTTPQPQPQPVAAVPEPDDPKPDRYDQPEEYEAWLERRNDRRLEEAVKKAIAPLAEENQRLQGLMHSREAGDAMTTVRQAVEQHNPYVIDALDHPDFEANYRQLISTQPTENLRNPRVLAQLAGAAAGSLDQTKAVARAPKESGGGRDMAYDAARESLARGGSREAGPVPRQERQERLLPEERIVMREAERHSGKPITREEWDALDATNIEDYNRRLAGSRSRARR